MTTTITHNGEEYLVDVSNTDALDLARKYARNYGYNTDTITLCGILVELYIALDDEDKDENIFSAVTRIKE